MPNEPKSAKEKRAEPRRRENSQDDHEGSAHTPDEFHMMNPVRAEKESIQTSIDAKWSGAVEFETNSPGIYRSVDTTLEALHVLDGWWLKIDGIAFKEAINTCIGATRGEASHEDARAAFINALAEGGVVTRTAGPPDNEVRNV